MAYLLGADLSSGYEKVWLELQAMAWNKPDLKKRLARVSAQWRAVLTRAFGEAMREYELDPNVFPLDAVVSLVMTFNEGIFLERMSGIETGHAGLLAMIDRWVASMERERKRS